MPIDSTNATPRNIKIGSQSASVDAAEEARTTDRIAPDDWSALLTYADAIGFFTRPEPPAATPDARIFHVAITAGDQSRELAVDDPFEMPELAMLIRLARRAIRDRIVQRTAMLDEQQPTALRLPDRQGRGFDRVRSALRRPALRKSGQAPE